MDIIFYQGTTIMTKQEKYQWYKDNNICPQCKQPWNGIQVMCDCCRSKAEELRRKKRQQRQAAGLCNRCGKHPAIEGTKYCIECAEKSKKHKDSEETKKKRLIKYHEVYKSQLQAKRIAFKEKGLCTDCGERKQEYGVVCGNCYTKRRKWYENSKMRGLNIKCDGDCTNCNLPWCIDIDEEVNIKLTPEEKKLSRELDKEATADERRWKRDRQNELYNARKRIEQSQATIADIESRREQGEVILPREELKLQKAVKRIAENQAILDSHS